MNYEPIANNQQLKANSQQLQLCCTVFVELRGVRYSDMDIFCNFALRYGKYRES